MKIIVIVLSLLSFLVPLTVTKAQQISDHGKHDMQGNMNENLQMTSMHKYIHKIEAELAQLKQEKSVAKKKIIMASMQKNMQRLHRQMEKMLQKGLANMPMDKQISMMESHLSLMKMVMSKH